MAKTLISCPILLPQFFFCEFYLYELNIVPSYHPIQFKEKLMNQASENYRKPDFGRFGQQLAPPPIFFHWFYNY